MGEGNGKIAKACSLCDFTTHGHVGQQFDNCKKTGRNEKSQPFLRLGYGGGKR